MRNVGQKILQRIYLDFKSVLIYLLVLSLFALAVAEILNAFELLPRKDDHAKVELAAKLILACIFVILISRAGPLMKLKIFGNELEFESVKNVVEKSNSQDIEIQKLKNDVAGLIALVKPTLASDEVGEVEAWREMPTLGPATVKEDENKGRFGNSDVVAPFAISAEFRNKHFSDRVIPIVISVKRIDGAPMSYSVRFFLHKTFGKMADVVVAPKDGQVSLTTLAVGGFTVGAWVVSTDVLLELDLSTLPSAPEVIRLL